MKKYLFEFDDPYAILAYCIVSQNRPADVIRILDDNEYLKTLISKEVRQQDFCGHFLDCIIEDILENKDRMEYMHALDRLSEYFYNKLDKERLRENILSILDKMGVSF